MFSQNPGRPARPEIQRNFPTRPDLGSDQYPDVTSAFDDAKFNMYMALPRTHHWNTPEGIGGLFTEKFQPGGEWDLNVHPDFPGVDKQGNTQYAKWNNSIVNSTFLNHHLLGMGIAGASHYPDYNGLDTENLYGEPLKMDKLNSLFSEPQAVMNGYKAYHGDKSWQTQTFGNRLNADTVLQGHVEKNEGDSHELLRKIGRGVLKAGEFGLGFLSEYGQAPANYAPQPTVDFRLASANSPVYDVPQRLPRVEAPPSYQEQVRSPYNPYTPPAPQPEFRPHQIPRPVNPTSHPSFTNPSGLLYSENAYTGATLPEPQYQPPEDWRQNSVAPLFINPADPLNQLAMRPQPVSPNTSNADYNANTGYEFLNHSHPTVKPLDLTEQPAFRQRAAELRKIAAIAKQLETVYKNGDPRGLDSVDAVQQVMKAAVTLSGNNPEIFIRLMNEVLIADQSYTKTLGIKIPRGFPEVIKGYSRIEFGDIGMNPIYRDKTPYQMTHLWAYVNYGYFYVKDFAKTGNILHELVEYNLKEITSMQSQKVMRGSEEDLRLGALGINIGTALRRKTISPMDFMQKFDRMLRTKDYDVISLRNLLLGPLPKQGK